MGLILLLNKNLFDWCSRINPRVFQDKKMVLLATSPGPGGASSVLTTAKQSMPFFGGEVKATLSIPNFFHNFDEDKQQLKDDALKQQLIKTIESLS